MLFSSFIAAPVLVFSSASIFLTICKSSSVFTFGPREGYFVAITVMVRQPLQYPKLLSDSSFISGVGGSSTNFKENSLVKAYMPRCSHTGHSVTLRLNGIGDLLK